METDYLMSFSIVCLIVKCFVTIFSVIIRFIHIKHCLKHFHYVVILSYVDDIIHYNVSNQIPSFNCSWIIHMQNYCIGV